MTLFELNGRIQKYQVEHEVQRIVEFKKDNILDLNRKEQLFNKGENRRGQVLGFYKPITEELSGGKKKAGDPYNFFDTGDFFEKFDLNYQDGQLDFFSTASKAPKLEKKFKDLYGTNTENTKKIPREINPLLLKSFNDKVL